MFSERLSSVTSVTTGFLHNRNASVARLRELFASARNAIRVLYEISVRFAGIFNHPCIGRLALLKGNVRGRTRAVHLGVDSTESRSDTRAAVLLLRESNDESH